jgi:hypothetical protein
MAIPPTIFDVLNHFPLIFDGGFTLSAPHEVPHSSVPAPIYPFPSPRTPLDLDPAPAPINRCAQTSDEAPPDLVNGRQASAVMRTAQRRARRSEPVRRRGQNKRRPGTGYADMMVHSFQLVLNRGIVYSPANSKDKLPIDVQVALQTDYPGCCEVVRGKDISTVQKHQFSRGHFAHLPPEHRPSLPSFTCPAFLSLHGKCKHAK